MKRVIGPEGVDAPAEQVIAAFGAGTVALRQIPRGGGLVALEDVEECLGGVRPLQQGLDARCPFKGGPGSWGW